MVKRYLLTKGGFTLGVFLWGAPIFLAAGAAVSPLSPALWLGPLLLALLLACAACLLPRKARVPGVAVGALTAAAAAWALGRYIGTDARGYALAGLAAIACAVHAALLSREESVGFWCAGVPVYLAARVAVNALYLNIRPTLLALAACYFVFLILRLSQVSLREGMGGGRGPSRVMRLRNAAAALAFAVLLLLFAFLPQVAALLRLVWRQIARLLAWISSLLPLHELRGTGGRGGGGDMPLLEEAADAAPFWIFLEKVVYVVCAVILAVLAFLMLRALARALRVLLKRFLAWLRAYAGAVTEGYEDTVESLIDWGEARRAWAERQRRRREKREAEIPWERLTPRQRVRRSLRDYLRRHPEAAESATARSLLRDEKKAALYEAARYSDLEITSEQAEQMRDLR